MTGVKILVLVVLLSITCRIVECTAQVADSIQYPQWKMESVGKLHASQAGYRNWTEGGISSLASTALLTGKVERTSRNWLQTYEIRLSFGILKQDTLDVRKADDLIRAKGQISYTGDGIFKNFNPTVAMSIRTQFAPGFDYKNNPLGTGEDPPIKVSDIFSPATFTQSLGLSYGSSWGFKQRVGIAAKETAILIDRLRVVYGLAKTEVVRLQVGAESHTEVDYEVVKNVAYKSTLGLFAAFNQDNLPDMLWENMIIMKVNSWLSTDLELVMLYDRDINDELQIKEMFSIGLSVILI